MQLRQLLFIIFQDTVSIELRLYSHRGIDTAPLYTVYPDPDLHKGKILKPDTDLFRRNGAPHIKKFKFNTWCGAEMSLPFYEVIKERQKFTISKKILVTKYNAKRSCQNSNYICSPDIKNMQLFSIPRSVHPAPAVYTQPPQCTPSPRRGRISV
jgi:hypothetical protein